MDTKTFRTRTDFRSIDYPSTGGKLVIGLDAGYSSVKSVYRKGVCCFPSYVNKLTSKLITSLDDNEIVYTDLVTGDRYCVGDFATASLQRGQYVTEKTLYEREHYMTPEYLAQFRCGMAFGLWDEPDYKKDGVFVQAGLPPAYINDDTPLLKHVAIGTHAFSVEKGKQKKEFEITLTEDDFDVMIQPMGTLFSIGTDDSGKLTPELNKYFSSKVLIFDGGFGTLDLFEISNKQNKSVDTNDQLGMRRVLDETRKLIKADPAAGMDISIPEMQTVLENGYVIKKDPINRKTTKIDISEYLKQANQKVCDEAFDSISSYIFEADYLIMSGGTGAAWHHSFKEKLKDIETIQVLPGNLMTNLPYLYANARGYFMYRTRMIKNALKGKKG